MKISSICLSLIIVCLLVACSPQDNSEAKTSQLETLDKKLSELKASEGFDDREEIFDYQLDTLSEDEVIFAVKTTDAEFSGKAVQIAREEGFLKSEVINLPVDSQLLATPYGVVSQSVANMRVGPSRTRAMATQTLMGMELELLEVDDGGFWHRVRTAQGYIAWIPKPSFEYLTKAQADSLRALPKVIVTATTTFAYENESEDRVVTDLVHGNVLTLVEEGSHYSKIMIPGGRRGFVRNAEVTPLDEWQQNAKFDKSHLVGFAYNFNGQPYLWGGNSLKGVDCSGFTGAVYYSMGTFLPRDASQQFKQGDEVTYAVEEVEIDGVSYKKMMADNLEVGDLLFFGDKEKGRVTHVAIWIGNDEFIHSSGRVHVTNVDPGKDNYEESYIESLVGIKRINGSQNLAKTIDLTKSNIWY